MKYILILGFIAFSIYSATIIFFTVCINFNDVPKLTFMDLVILATLAWASAWVGHIFVWQVPRWAWKHLDENLVTMCFLALVITVPALLMFFAGLTGQIMNHTFFLSKCLCAILFIPTVELVISSQISAYQQVKKLFVLA